MTSSDIRQSFLDFFKSKQHSIVPSSSLMPDSPNLLFTNAGMNQFVPIFLGQTKCPYHPPRAADTQKCIRAGGKHNDLDDVGLDTYHHTFFEMLGNWSFGDYFKREAIDWAWELITEVWKFSKNRLYATVYSPDKAKGDPSDFDQEAYDFWAAKFTAAGLDPKIHIVHGNKKDNFWMMGETGPCGPCSELHVDLTPAGDTAGRLVNQGSAHCIEIWNLVFIQFNANPDGTFSPLPARHVDTGMGFERASSIIQCTKNFTDFTGTISNYETDIFRPIFDVLEKMSGKKYASTLPPSGSIGENEQEKIDVAFRVIADHIRTLSFAIADGIQPGNTDRNYVLRRILRRAVRYGRTLGFHHPFFYKLVDVLATTMGHVFPEIREKKNFVQEVIQREEEAFNKTLDKGIAIFQHRTDVQPDLDELVKKIHESTLVRDTRKDLKELPQGLEDAETKLKSINKRLEHFLTGKRGSLEGFIVQWGIIAKESFSVFDLDPIQELLSLYKDVDKFSKGQGNSREQFEAFHKDWDQRLLKVEEAFLKARQNIRPGVLPAGFCFSLFDTYGFPLDLTELMARELGLAVDKDGFDKLMEEQRNRARAAHKRELIELFDNGASIPPTRFVGFEQIETKAKVLATPHIKGKIGVMLDVSASYAEMGGQVGDTGQLAGGGQLWRIVDTKKAGGILHFLEEGVEAPLVGMEVIQTVDAPRRNAIQRHHSVTHLLHWALHEVVSREATQKGSFVGPEKLTFDFNSAALTLAQLSDIEMLVNERILENAPISWTEVPHADVKSRKDVMQFFGDKYGEVVRVVQIGGTPGKLDGYSMELCGGTHARATGEIGLFRIVSESAVAAGVRRIEAVAGLAAYQTARNDVELIRSVAGRISAPLAEVDKKIEALLLHQKELEKSLKAAIQRSAAQTAAWLLTRVQTVNEIPLITQIFPDSDSAFLEAVIDALKPKFKGVIVVGGSANGAVTLVANVSPDFTAKVQAGKIIQAIAPIVGGKGGGKPDNARGGGKDVAKLGEALAKVASLLG